MLHKVGSITKFAFWKVNQTWNEFETSLVKLDKLIRDYENPIYGGSTGGDRFIQ